MNKARFQKMVRESQERCSLAQVPGRYFPHKPVLVLKGYWSDFGRSVVAYRPRVQPGDDYYMLKNLMDKTQERMQGWLNEVQPPPGLNLKPEAGIHNTAPSPCGEIYLANS